MNIDQPESTRSPGENLKLRNNLQIQIAKRYCVECENEALLDWVLNELSPKVSELLKQKPELLSDYARDPSGTLDRVDEELHLKNILKKE